DADGIVLALSEVATAFFVTAPDSDRATDADVLADLLEARELPVAVFPELESAAEAARTWASSAPRRAVIVTGSVVLAGEAITLAADNEWKAGSGA
ncbi:MAG: hypothetical protein U1C73_18960, partial [Dietzia sp.]|nr:hypothetical protein [Dietzia sp.]